MLLVLNFPLVPVWLYLNAFLKKRDFDSTGLGLAILRSQDL